MKRNSKSVFGFIFGIPTASRRTARKTKPVNSKDSGFRSLGVRKQKKQSNYCPLHQW